MVYTWFRQFNTYDRCTAVILIWYRWPAHLGICFVILAYYIDRARSSHIDANETPSAPVDVWSRDGIRISFHWVARLRLKKFKFWSGTVFIRNCWFRIGKKMNEDHQHCFNLSLMDTISLDHPLIFRYVDKTPLHEINPFQLLMFLTTDLWAFG